MEDLWLFLLDTAGRMTTWEFWSSYLPYYLIGSVVTIELTVVAVVAGTFLGLFAALAKISAGQNILTAGLKRLAGLYTWAIRGTPLLVQIYLVHFGLNQFDITLTRFQSGAIALSVNAGAYITEIIRAGILSIDKGQMEAARALGMSYAQAMRRVILPQAYRRLTPPLINEFVALLKDSSLVSVIGLVELMRTARIYSSSTFRPFDAFFLAALIYLLLTTVFTTIGSYVEKRLEVYEK